MSIFSCIENGSFRSIFRAQLARKNLHKNCVWASKVFEFSFRKTWQFDILSGIAIHNTSKVHLYFTCNKSELAILEFTLPLFSYSLLLSNLDFTGEFCQIMIAQIVWYARKELNKKKVEIFHQEFL